MQKCSGNDELAINKELIKIEQSLSIKNTVDSPALLCNNADQKAIMIQQIIRIINYFLTFVNVNQKPEGIQIQVLAGDLYDKFKYDTLDDVILFFKYARQGNYGAIKFKLDSSDILAWVPLYMDIKAEEREKFIRKQKRPNAIIIDDLEEPEEMTEAQRQKLDDFIKTLKKPKSRLITEENPALDFSEYLKALPITCKNLSDSDLVNQISNARNTFPEAFEILEAERINRLTKKDNNIK